jgi:hypothetical protein
LGLAVDKQIKKGTMMKKFAIVLLVGALPVTTHALESEEFYNLSRETVAALAAVAHCPEFGEFSKNLVGFKEFSAGDIVHRDKNGRPDEADSTGEIASKVEYTLTSEVKAMAAKTQVGGTLTVTRTTYFGVGPTDHRIEPRYSCVYKAK